MKVSTDKGNFDREKKIEDTIWDLLNSFTEEFTLMMYRSRPQRKIEFRLKVRITGRR